MFGVVAGPHGHDESPKVGPAGTVVVVAAFVAGVDDAAGVDEATPVDDVDEPVATVVVGAAVVTAAAVNAVDEDAVLLRSLPQAAATSVSAVSAATKRMDVCRIKNPPGNLLVGTT